MRPISSASDCESEGLYDRFERRIGLRLHGFIIYTNNQPASRCDDFIQEMLD